MKRHAKSGRGFSIIELMVVIGIIGLLASIAMSEFSLFRKQAADKTALADLRNVLTAQEAYFVNNGTYTNDLGQLSGLVTSQGITITITAASATNWAGNAFHAKGQSTYCYELSGSAVITPIAGTAAVCP